MRRDKKLLSYKIILPSLLSLMLVAFNSASGLFVFMLRITSIISHIAFDSSVGTIPGAVACRFLMIEPTKHTKKKGSKNLNKSP